MRRIVAGVAVACALGAYAEERTVSDAAGLVAAIQALNSGPRLTSPNVIYLEPGDYDVSAYQMGYYDSNGNLQTPGLSHIAISSVNLVGKSDNPRDTVIYGNRTLGIVRCHYAGLQNLTVSNGYLNVENAYGAGVGSTGAASVHSNVVVTCCTLDVAEGNGGGIVGGTWYDSTIISNSAARTAGGGAQGGRLHNCNVISNYAGAAGGGCYYGSLLYDCRVVGNRSKNGGGVCSTSKGSNCYVYGGLIADNYASGYGGGVAYSLLCGGTVVSNNVAVGNGGGIYNDATRFVSNTVVCCNSAANGGGCVGGSNYWCTITCNTVTGYGGGGYTGIYSNCTVSGNSSVRGGGLYGNGCVGVDCRIYGNLATGVADKDGGGGCYGGSYTDCTISNNLALYLGGGGYNCIYRGCLIACNMATSGVGEVQGGGLYTGKAYSCVISNNTVKTLGSGTHSYGAGASEASIYDSVVVHNLNLGGTSKSNGYGGGGYNCTISNSLVTGNAVYAPNAKNHQGGGAHNCTLYDSVIQNNYVDSNNGSGMNGGKAYGCVISNNMGSGTSSYAVRQVKRLENCTVVGIANVYSGPAVNCRFVNFTNGVYFAPGENVYLPNGKTRGATSASACLLNTGLFATNCLIANNTVGGGIFKCSGVSSVKLCNCTISGNTVPNTFLSLQPTSRVEFVNCIFSGNRKPDGTAYDMMYGAYDAAENDITKLTFRNCLIGPLRPAAAPGVEENTVTNVAGFVRKGDDWYALKQSSPARGQGLVQDWMTNALDIRKDPAFPRLRDGLVDIGCYQCWLDPVGLWFSIR